MKPWQQSLRDFVDARAESGRLVVPILAQEFTLSHRAELTADADAHMLRRVKSEIRSYLHGGNSAQDQLVLPGMDLPSFIAVRNAGSKDAEYVRTTDATWADLLSGREERVNNVSAAQAKLESYDRSMDLLRSVMSTNPAMSVKEALQLIYRGNAA
jgi:hypothetical protein